MFAQIKRYPYLTSELVLWGGTIMLSLLFTVGLIMPKLPQVAIGLYIFTFGCLFMILSSFILGQANSHRLRKWLVSTTFGCWLICTVGDGFYRFMQSEPEAVIMGLLVLFMLVSVFRFLFNQPNRKATPRPAGVFMMTANTPEEYSLNENTRDHPNRTLH